MYCAQVLVTRGVFDLTSVAATQKLSAALKARSDVVLVSVGVGRSTVNSAQLAATASPGQSFVRPCPSTMPESVCFVCEEEIFWGAGLFVLPQNKIARANA